MPSCVEVSGLFVWMVGITTKLQGVFGERSVFSPTAFLASAEMWTPPNIFHSHLPPDLPLTSSRVPDTGDCCVGSIYI